MGENSNIAWTRSTFNPWIGCTKVSPGCDNCYAAEWDRRWGNGDHWGARQPRRRTSRDYWKQPAKWNREAEEKGVRFRVFCASLADIADNHGSILPEWRDELWEIVRQTPFLVWLMLTKRPQNLERYLPKDWGAGYANVMLGTTTENQEEYCRRKPVLASIPAAGRFLSMEPLIEPVEVGQLAGIHWVITGGENSAQHRDVPLDAYRAIRDACDEQGVAFYHKQFGGRNRKEIEAKGVAIDGEVRRDYPEMAG